MSWKKAFKKATNIMAHINPITAPFAFGKDIVGSMSKNRQQKNSDNAALEEQRARMDALGLDEMGKYDTGFITEGQQATIDRTKAGMSAQLKQAMGEAGIGDSTMMESGKASIEQSGLTMKENIRESHWDAAMKAYGLESDVVNQMHQMNKANMDANIAMFTGLMSTLTGTASMVFSGGNSPIDAETADAAAGAGGTAGGTAGDIWDQ